MTTKYRPRATDGEIPFPMAPLIDLTFLLLIFFMVTSRISKEPVQEAVKLPIASAGQIPRDISHRDVVCVSSRGAISVSQKVLDAPGLGNYLRARLQKFPGRKIYLKADAVTPARQIKQIISIATDAGAQQVILGTYRQ